MASKRRQVKRDQGQIIARGDRKWLLRVYVGRDAQGKKKYRSETFEGTFKMAEAEVTRMAHEVNQGSYTAPSKVTVKEYIETWLRESKNEIKERTRRTYEEGMKTAIVPSIGHIRLDQLSHFHVQGMVNGMVKAGKSPATVRMRYMVVNQALEHACHVGLLQRNVAAHVSLPKMVKTAKTILTPEQVSLFLEKTQGTRYHALWYTLLTTGIRPGEAYALRWQDFADGMLHIRHTLMDNKRSRGPVLETPKTEKGYRRVPLPASTIAVLEAHRREQLKEMLQAGPAYDRTHSFIFATKEGRAMCANSIQKVWRRALVANGLPDIRLYSERHTHLSHLLASGADIKAVSERAGHANVKITLDTYYQVLPQQHQQLAAATDTILFQQRKA